MGRILDTFKSNVDSVEKLVNFDREVLAISIDNIRELNKLLRDKQKIDNPRLNGENTLRILESIRTNDSLKLKYSIINNQAVVLLVSYFSSAAADLFRQAAKFALMSKKEKSVISAEFKFKISELLEFSEAPEDYIGDLLISKVGISFQDMKSIQREFKKYFGIEIEKDAHVKNIILGHACRHTIAHEASIINKRVLNQVSNASPRELKPTLVLGEKVEFSQEEINVLAQSMIDYIQNIESKVSEYRYGI